MSDARSRRKLQKALKARSEGLRTVALNKHVGKQRCTRTPNEPQPEAQSPSNGKSPQGALIVSSDCALMEMTLTSDADDVTCFLRSAGPREHTPAVLLLPGKSSHASIPTTSSLYKPRSCLEVLPSVPRIRTEVFIHVCKMIDG